MKTEQNINKNEINTDSKKNESTTEKRINPFDTLFKNFFDDFFEFPLKLSNHLKDLSIRQKFEEEKRIPVTNLDEFFKMCEKKHNKYDDIPVTNIREFFELC